MVKAPEMTPTPNVAYAKLASDEQIERTVKALAANGITTHVVASGEEAKRLFFEIVPKGAEVKAAASKTLQDLGIADAIDKSGRFDAVRPKVFSMDRKTQADEMRILGVRPAYAVGSAQAVTEDGCLLFASKTGSQLGPYASGAGKVVLVVGAQKIVKNVNEGLRRLEEYSFPIEDVRAREAYGMPSALNKILIVGGEIIPERITVILVKEELGI